MKKIALVMVFVSAAFTIRAASLVEPYSWIPMVIWAAATAFWFENWKKARP